MAGTGTRAHNLRRLVPHTYIFYIRLMEVKNNSRSRQSSSRSKARAAQSLGLGLALLIPAPAAGRRGLVQTFPLFPPQIGKKV